MKPKPGLFDTPAGQVRRRAWCCVLFLSVIGLLLSPLTARAQSREPHLFLSRYSLLQETGFSRARQFIRSAAGLDRRDPGFWETGRPREFREPWRAEPDTLSFRNDIRTLPSRLVHKTSQLLSLQNLAFLSVAARVTDHSSDDWDQRVRHEVAENPRQLGSGNSILDSVGSNPVQLGAASFLYGASLYFDSTRLHDFSLDVIDLILIDGPLVEGLKYSFDTTRPNGEPRGFPSGHTASSFAIAAAVHRNFGFFWGAMAYGLAGSVGLHRIDVQKHDLSDVLFGAALGLVVGHATSGNDLHFGDDGPRVVPVVSPTTGAAGLGLEWRF